MVRREKLVWSLACINSTSVIGRIPAQVGMGSMLKIPIGATHDNIQLGLATFDGSESVTNALA